MKKNTVHVFGKEFYYIGTDSNGTKHYLQKFSFDCEWYWGGGYIESFTNNRCPEKSRDISQHQHFDSLIFKGNKNGFDMFKEVFPDNPFSDNEIWKLCELMKSFYIMREYSDTLHRGGAHYTSNPCAEIIKNDEEYNRINKVVIPAIIEELTNILV